jgi:hypothetical protein
MSLFPVLIIVLVRLIIVKFCLSQFACLLLFVGPCQLFLIGGLGGLASVSPCFLLLSPIRLPSLSPPPPAFNAAILPPFFPPSLHSSLGYPSFQFSESSHSYPSLKGTKKTGDTPPSLPPSPTYYSQTCQYLRRPVRPREKNLLLRINEIKKC